MNRRNASPVTPWLVWLAVLVACAAPASPPSPPPGGFVSLTWQILDARGAPRSCAETGAVQLVLRFASQIAGHADQIVRLPCDPGRAVGAPVVPGVYLAIPSLVDGSGRTIVAATPILGFSISRGLDAKLGNIVFTL